MLGIVDFIELAVKGNWKVLGWFILGAFSIGLIRVVRGLWIERQTQKDEEFIRAHQAIPIETLKKRAWTLLGSAIVLLVLVLPVTLWITVEVLKSIEGINPGIALAFVFTVFLLILIIMIIQTVRYRRLRRRIVHMH